MMRMSRALQANLETEDVSQSPIGSRSTSTTRALLQAVSTSHLQPLLFSFEVYTS